jgi:hypothetical protein
MHEYYATLSRVMGPDKFEVILDLGFNIKKKIILTMNGYEGAVDYASGSSDAYLNTFMWFAKNSNNFIVKVVKSGDEYKGHFISRYKATEDLGPYLLDLGLVKRVKLV